MAIPPIDGVLHTAKDGDTIEKIAKLDKVTADQIVAYEPNQLANADAPLITGQVIIVPDGDKTPPEEVVSVPAPGPLAAAVIGSGRASACEIRLHLAGSMDPSPSASTVAFIPPSTSAPTWEARPMPRMKDP